MADRGCFTVTVFLAILFNLLSLKFDGERVLFITDKTRSPLRPIFYLHFE